MNKINEQIVEVPYKKLQPEILQAVIEEFVTRDKTDFGDEEISLKQKVDLVMNQLKANTAVLVFDTISETCNIVLKDNLLKYNKTITNC